MSWVQVPSLAPFIARKTQLECMLAAIAGAGMGTVASCASTPLALSAPTMINSISLLWAGRDLQFGAIWPRNRPGLVSFTNSCRNSHRLINMRAGKGVLCERRLV